MQFSEQVYLPDLMAIASFYKDWGLRWRPVQQAMCCPTGIFPEYANDYSAGNLLLPRGAIINGNLNEVHEVDQRDSQEIQEFVAHSWYSYDDEIHRPAPLGRGYRAQLRARPQRHRHPHCHIEDAGRTGQVFLDQEPALEGTCHGGGPAGRATSSAMRPGQPGVPGTHRKTADRPGAAGRQPCSLLWAVPRRGGWSACGRRTSWSYFYDKLIGTSIRNGDLATANTERWDPSTWPADVKGVGFTEAPRGALGHWVHIRKDTKIENYQAVVPTTWNAGPRDADGNIGAYEASLLDTPMADNAEQPLEILRTIHSFDPCLACSTHVMSPEGEAAGRYQGALGGIRHGAPLPRRVAKLSRVSSSRWYSHATEVESPASKIYVYEAPLRIWHWLNALCIVVLCVTGYLIGKPPTSVVPGKLQLNYLFGYIRHGAFRLPGRSWP